VVSRRATVFAIAGVAIAVACVLAWRAAWTCDDALISFRYLRHWLAGDGLVFNAGEHVEGFSSFAFVVLLAPCDVLGADPMVAANVIGIVATAVQLGAIVWLLARREAPLAVIAVVAALLATDRIAVVWGTGGLETALHGALVLGVLAVQLERPDRIRTLAALHVVLAASRPEGIVFAIVWFAHLGATRRWAELRRALNWFVPLAVVLLAARLLYYRELVANPYRAKVEGVPTLAAGARYTLAFLQRMGLYGVAAAAVAPLVVLGVRGWRGDPRWHAPLVLASVFIAVQLAAVLVVGGDYMTDFRLLAPIVGPFYVAVGCLAALAWRQRAAAAAVLALFAAGHAYRQLSPIAVSPDAPPPAEHKQILTIARDQPARFARALGVFAEPGDSILADWAGYMAYGHDLRTVDATGLVSTHVTRDFYLRPVDERLPGHARWPTIEFMQRERLTFIFPKINDRPPEDPEIDERSPARRRDYPFLHVTVPLEGGHYLRFFTTLDADALARRARAKQVRTCFRPAFGALTCIP
jgi:hypothetical protein